MKFLPLVWKNVWRRKFRTTFTLLSIFIAFLLFVGAGFRIALQAQRPFPKLFAAGLTSIIGIQTFVILGGVTRLIPLTGVTLPFISYGGSSLIANFVILAFIAPLMLIIELFSHSFRPISLGIRLYANMFADHQVIDIDRDLGRDGVRFGQKGKLAIDDVEQTADLDAFGLARELDRNGHAHFLIHLDLDSNLTCCITRRRLAHISRPDHVSLKVRS